MSLKDAFVMMQDNRPKYDATNTRALILYNIWKHLETPLQSSDINIIKNIWDHLKWEIRSQHISSRNDRKRTIF